MASLPTIGGSDGTWGTEMNEYLGIGHNTDGTHKGQSSSASIDSVSSVSTSSTSLIDMTGLSVTITTTGGDLLILADIPFKSTNAADYAGFRLLYDGGEQTNKTVCANHITFGNTATFLVKRQATAGLHTIKIQWKRASGSGTLTCPPTPSGLFASARLTVIELPQ